MHVILMVTVMLLIGSCLYVPTPEHGDSQIPDDVMNFLVPGKTTRADVLLRFADPVQRLEEDRYFIYHWETAIGYIIYGAGYWGDVIPNKNPHYLCLDFTSDGKLYRWKHFQEGYIQRHPEKQILEWMQKNSQQQ